MKYIAAILILISIKGFIPVEVSCSKQIQTDTSLYKISYVKKCTYISITDDMVLNDSVRFNKLKQEYNNIIIQKFTPNQIRSIKEICISNSESFDYEGSNFVGLCIAMNYNNSYILIASNDDDHLSNLLHECCHALYFDNIELFNSKYKDRWEKLNNQFVSNYAKCSIKEDFAETGETYLCKYKIVGCKEKLKLFEEFYNETK